MHKTTVLQRALTEKMPFRNTLNSLKNLLIKTLIGDSLALIIQADEQPMFGELKVIKILFMQVLPRVDFGKPKTLEKHGNL